MTTGYRSDVFTSEIDLTFTTQLAAASWAVALGQSKEGPLTPQFVTDGPDFVSIYGEPDASISYLHHSALAFLKEGGGMWIKRVTDGTATYGGRMVTKDSDGINGVNTLVAETPISNPVDVTFGDDDVFYIYAIGPGAYSSNIECEIISNNLEMSTVSASASNNDNSGLATTTAYQYQVTAVSSAGESSPSTETTAITTDGTNKQEITLTWNNVVGAQGYRVYRKTASGTYDFLTSVSANPDDTVTYADVNAASVVDTSSHPPTTAATEPQFILNVYDTRISSTIARESFECSLKNRKNGLGEQTAIEQRVNNSSKYIRVESNIDPRDSTVAPTVYSVPQFELDAGAPGGNIAASDLISAIEEFRDKDSYPAAVFLDGGYRGSSMVSYHKRIQTICDARGDAIGFTSVPPEDQKAQDAIAFRAITQNINSNRMALFCNDHERLDEYSGETLFVPSSAVAAARLAYTDRVANPAYSIAGFRRGVAGETLKLREKYSDSERDQMAWNNVNYFTTERGAGFVLREAYTLQSAYSALSHISVRRVLDIIEQSTERSLKFYLQEPNDDILVIRMMANLRRFYATLTQRRMIKSAEVISNTPPNEVDLGNLQIYSLIVPLLPAVRIRHTVVPTRQGVSFDAVAEQLGIT